MRTTRTFITALVLAAAAAVPATAGSRATMRLVAYVPVQCEARLVDGAIDGSTITVNLRRTCNTGHAIHVATPDASGPVTIIERRTGRTVSGSSAVFVQPERYVDGLDQIVIDCGDDDPAHVSAIARGLKLNVEVS
ncbi:hypothetical protein [Brevundimonas sp.]|uniref:hypothetical protein n=1 Tax=Brevundimonas sp. TaxID=1871086 RepID=UPI0035B4622C